MQELLLDKSFLDGAPSKIVANVCDNYAVLCSESLFFELMTTNPESQLRCFSKIPNRPNAVALIPSIDALLRFEAENRMPCIPLFERKIEGSYVFNNKLGDGTYNLEGEVLETLNTWRSQVAKDVQDFLLRCRIVYQFFPELNGIEYRDFPTAVSAARIKLATDINFVVEIYESFLDEDAPDNVPNPSWLDPRWVWFRWVQCQILAALRVFQKYQGRIPEMPSEGTLLRVEHAMHDADYVILGALAGAIATGDHEVEDDFRLVRPDGLVISRHEVE